MRYKRCVSCGAPKYRTQQKDPRCRACRQGKQVGQEKKLGDKLLSPEYVKRLIDTYPYLKEIKDQRYNRHELAGYSDIEIVSESDRGKQILTFVELKSHRGKLSWRQRRFRKRTDADYYVVRSEAEFIAVIKHISIGEWNIGGYERQQVKNRVLRESRHKRVSVGSRAPSIAMKFF